MAHLRLTTIVQLNVSKNSKSFATNAVVWDIEPRIVQHRTVKFPKSLRETRNGLSAKDLATSVPNEYSVSTSFSPLSYSGGEGARMSPGESRVYLDSDNFSENDCAALTFYEQGTRCFVKLKFANRELGALVDSGSTKSILVKQGIELAAEFNQEIKPSVVKAILFPNGSIELFLGQVALPSTLDVVQKCVEYKAIPNFKYQCVPGMDAIRQFRLIVDATPTLSVWLTTTKFTAQPL